MNTSSLFTILAVVASTSLLNAAPAVSTKDLSKETLTGIATERQVKSIKDYEEAKAKASAERKEAIAEAKKVTKINDEGMKKTIQKRTLNNMLPACERASETPRKPDTYIIR